MKPILVALLLIAGVLVVFGALDRQERGRVVSAWQDSVRVAQQDRDQWQARYAEAATSVSRSADTVLLRTTRYRDIRSTLLITDTVIVKEALAVADSVANSCQELANACERFRVAADGTIASLGRERDAYRNLYDAVKPRFRDRLGIFAGYGISGGQDHTARHGVVIGVGVRLFP